MMHATYSADVQKIEWLSGLAYEVTLSRPHEFSFTPGQRIRFIEESLQRDYTIISGPEDPVIKLCVRHITDGTFSPRLARALPGDTFRFTGPHGYFRYTATGHQAVFVATGTGIAPFVSFSGNHTTGFILLHGVSGPDELYYKDMLKTAAALYVPCFSSLHSEHSTQDNAFKGRVSRYIEEQLPAGTYDFYLCGNNEMIADVTEIIDARFPECKVFTESFT